MVYGVSQDKPRDSRSADPVASQFIAVIERLRQLPPGWYAAATAVFSAIDTSGTSGYSELVPLLAAVPAPRIRAWLFELGGARDAPGVLAVPSISPAKLELLDRLFAVLSPGSDDALLSHSIHTRSMQQEPRRAWLAALAILSEHPAELQRGTIIARSVALVDEIRRRRSGAAVSPVLGRDGDASRAMSVDHSDPRQTRRVARQASGLDSATPARQVPQQKEAEYVTALDISRPTEAAGLYFLLNALRHLGIEPLLNATPDLASYGFLARLMLALAHYAGVAIDDPALEWAQSELAQSELGHADDQIPSAPAIDGWPRNVSAPSVELKIDAATLLRVWVLAVRRWCWRVAGMKLGEVVRRPGRVLVTRSDLDIFLSLELADVRLRRVGLDLDPGWLSWFGRVVRFHYQSETGRYTQQSFLEGPQ